MGFFKKESFTENKNEINENVVNEDTNTVTADHQVSAKSSFRRSNLSLFDIKDIEYVINNFPPMSIEIGKSLNSLAETLESTIDFIEDKSSEIIKKNRDFNLSQAHRDASIAIYDVVQNIRKYVDWMNDEYEKKLKKSEECQGVTKIEVEKIVDEELIKESNVLKIEIFKDLTLIEPKGFKLEENLVKVEDWNDLLVKTAEILNKQYKENKNSKKKIEKFIVDDKKSHQNSFRDTVIEMLNEYKIDLNEFMVIA
ncbi:MAG: hypothetical protein E7208_09815 [Clostridium butyricum]|nr:hypothetical protein [Clostridium butyricum]